MFDDEIVFKIREGFVSSGIRSILIVRWGDFMYLRVVRWGIVGLAGRGIIL